VSPRTGIVFLLLALASPACAEEAVDLELVLAIDGSSSVDEDEFALQMNGYAAAFRDARVQEAIVSGPRHAIAVSVLIWADATVPKSSTPWFALAGPADAETFATLMAGLPRGTEGGTGIGSGIAAAMRRLDRNSFVAPRQVVDVSGDGRETPARELVVTMPMAHAMARARGVTVNGLAILNEQPDLARWYRDNVIAGPGSFVMRAADYHDFAEAITRKLIKEIEWQERLSDRR
jgi:hypothetical protein